MMILTGSIPVSGTKTENARRSLNGGFFLALWAFAGFSTL